VFSITLPSVVIGRGADVNAPDADGAAGLEARTDPRQTAAPGAAPVAGGVLEDLRYMELKLEIYM
jgi:hypothetical protein